MKRALSVLWLGCQLALGQESAPETAIAKHHLGETFDEWAELTGMEPIRICGDPKHYKPICKDLQAIQQTGKGEITLPLDKSNRVYTFTFQDGKVAEVSNHAAVTAASAKEDAKLIMGRMARSVAPKPSDTQVFKDSDYLYRPPGDSKPIHLTGRLVFSSSEKNVVFISDRRKHKEPFLTFTIANSEVTNAVYERTATPRYAAGLFLAWPLLFTKEKKHFLTIQYKADSGDGKYAILQLDKDNYREILAAFEATFGKRVERVEER